LGQNRFSVFSTLPVPTLYPAKENGRSILRIVIPVALIIFLPLFIAPFNDDNELFQGMGWLYHAYGRINYLGLWDQNFPGITQFHSLIISLFGTSPWPNRLIDVGIHLVLTILLSLLVQRLYGRKAGIAVGIIYPFFHMLGGFWAVGQRDDYGSLLILIATIIYLYLYRTSTQKSSIKTSSLFFLCGILMALAINFRPTQGLFALSFAVLILIYGPKRWLSFFSYVLGGVMMWIAILWPQLTTEGGLHSFYVNAILFNTQVFNSSRYRLSFLTYFVRPREIIFDLLIIFWCIRYQQLYGKVAVSDLWQKIKRAPMEVILFALYVLCAKAGVYIMGRGYIAHYQPVIIMGAIFLAILIVPSIDMLRSRRALQYGIIGMLLVLLLGIYAGTRLPAYAKNMVTGKGASLDSLYVAVDGWELVYKQPTDYLLTHGAQGHRLEVYGWSPGLYWRTGCNSSTRFPFFLPLIMKNNNGELADFQKAWQKEYIDSLVQYPPKFLVIGKNSFGFGIFYYQQVAELVDSLPGLRSLINTDYKLDTTMKWWDIYEHR
jgi:hypothetical protein